MSGRNPAAGVCDPLPIGDRRMTATMQEAPAAVLTIGDMAFCTIPAELDGSEALHYWRGFARAEKAYAKKHGRPGVAHEGGAPRPGTPEHDALAATLAEQGRAYREGMRPIAHAAGMRAVSKYWQERGLEHRAAQITDSLAPVKAPRKRAAAKPVTVESAPVETVPAVPDLAALERAAVKAAEREARLVARYNRDYAAGKFTTNRPLAAQCEAAYSAKYKAAAALAAARETAGLPPVNPAHITAETIAAAAPSATDAAALRAGVESGRVVIMHVGKESPRKAPEPEPAEPVAVESAETEPAPEESAAYWAGVRARKALRRELAAAMRARGIEPRGEAWARECAAAGLPVGGEA